VNRFLDGIRVLELGNFISGPYAGLVFESEADTANGLPRRGAALVFANELHSAKRPVPENKIVVLLRLWSMRVIGPPFNQERIVLALTLALFLSFCLVANQFATPGNLISLLQSVAILGVLAVGMAFVIIGRGIDLTMVTVMAISVAWMFNEINKGLSVAIAFGLGIGLAALIGVANGVLVAYFEIPAIFTTLAMATLLYGLGRFVLIDSDTVFLSDQLETFKMIGAGHVLGIPASIIWAAAIALLCFVVLR
jgi:ribose transport system permease protein